MKDIVLISGASSGIGKETAVFLAQNGFKVYAASRRTEKMNDLREHGVETLSMDVTNDLSMTQAVDQIISKEGKIDILINNAGFGLYGALEDVKMEDVRYQLEVNVVGLARLTQLALPHMRQQAKGKIINITSIAGKVVAPFGGWYHSTKFAVEALSDALRNEVKPFGIDVIIIEPGVIKTEFGGIATENLLKHSGETVYSKGAKSTARAFVAMNKKGPGPDVIARLILKAIRSKCPKTRYYAGYMAGFSLFGRKILSDKLLDKAMQFQFLK